jgi:ribosome biogenesis GTPase
LQCGIFAPKNKGDILNILQQYGYNQSEMPDEGESPACVTAVHRERYELVTEAGLMYGKLKTSSYYGATPQPFPTVGDFVFFKDALGNDCQITKTLPRKSYFSRLDPTPGGHTEQAIAANFDTVFIMQSLNQNFNLRRLERYLALTWQSGAMPVIVLTKVDLSDKPKLQHSDVETIASGVEIVATSSVKRKE